MSEKRYQIALSYAGEQRDYVERVSNYLKSKNVRCFYDKDEEIRLWGTNILEFLQGIFADGQAYFVVMFISEEYVEKAFPRQELAFSLGRAINQQHEYILPARFDSTEVPGLSQLTTYLELRGKTPEEFAEQIIQKLTEQGIYLGTETPADAVEYQQVSQKNDSEVVITIKDEAGLPVSQADVYLIKQNGTHRNKQSDETGKVEFPVLDEISGFYTIFVAHENFPAGIVNDFQCDSDIEITLTRNKGIGSLIFPDGTGYIPGIKGRLNPILDSSNRTYMYTDNISINNGPHQPPVDFQFEENISLEDSDGKTADIKIHRIIQRCSILDYITHG